MMCILLGPPGVGKGTQCRRMVARYGWSVVATGDRLREAIRAGTPLGREAQTYMDAGHLVPGDVMIRLVRQCLAEIPANTGVIFDGFPRTLEQAHALDTLTRELQNPIRCVLFLVVDDNELRRRMLDRAAKEGRSDDTPETIATRLRTYRQQTEPLVNFYRSRGLLHEVPGDGTPDEVFAPIANVLDAVIANSAVG